MGSKIENFKPSSIRAIMSKINDDLIEGGHEVDDFVDSEYSDYYYIIEEGLNDLGMPAHIYDVEFILACLIENPNFNDTDEDLIIPKSRSFIVNHTVIRDVRMYENYSQDVESYLQLTQNLVEQYQELDQFHIFEGEITDTEYADSDWVNDEIDSIHER